MVWHHNGKELLVLTEDHFLCVNVMALGCSYLLTVNKDVCLCIGRELCDSTDMS